MFDALKPTFGPRISPVRRSIPSKPLTLDNSPGLLASNGGVKSPTFARQWVTAEVAEPFRAELEAFVATSKQQRPFGWSLVKQLQQACRRESSAIAAGGSWSPCRSGDRNASSRPRH